MWGEQISAYSLALLSRHEFLRSAVQIPFVHKIQKAPNILTDFDGFQCEALCADGYTYTIYFRNVKTPKDLLDKGLSFFTCSSGKYVLSVACKESPG